MLTPESFFRRFQSGVEVAIAVSNHAPDKVFGVRDGFQRFFDRVLDHRLEITVRQFRIDGGSLPMTTAETVGQARHLAAEAERMADDLGHGQAFAVGSESGLTVAEGEGAVRYFVDHWTVVRGLDDEAWGSSGCVQIPQRLIDGREGEAIPSAIPGTRRSGGMAASLTAGGVSRRSAAGQATFHALCSLFYGRLGVQAGT